MRHLHELRERAHARRRRQKLERRYRAQRFRERHDGVAVQFRADEVRRAHRVQRRSACRRGRRRDEVRRVQVIERVLVLFHVFVFISVYVSRVGLSGNRTRARGRGTESADGRVGAVRALLKVRERALVGGRRGVRSAKHPRAAEHVGERRRVLERRAHVQGVHRVQRAHVPAFPRRPKGSRRGRRALFFRAPLLLFGRAAEQTRLVEPRRRRVNFVVAARRHQDVRPAFLVQRVAHTLRQLHHATHRLRVLFRESVRLFSLGAVYANGRKRARRR
mmetsp:Transcript_11920/g.51110  ORF Transcript_11920/g.51110 Transcript_11920/m.51110 type:complete len:276 (-) Transcript_11920:621-1448(-)